MRRLRPLRRTAAASLVAAMHDVRRFRDTGIPVGNGARHIIGATERYCGAVAMRLAPGVGDNAPAFAGLCEAIFDAIARIGGNDERVAFSGAPLGAEAEGQRGAQEIQKNCRPRLATMHARTLDLPTLDGGHGRLGGHSEAAQ